MKVSLGAEVLAMPTPVWIVGSYGEDDKPNAMTIAWGGVCCSKPPCVAVSLRKATHTYGNVMRRKAFTVSVPSEQYAKEADYFGMASGRDVDKFQVTGLTPEPSQVVDAPYVKEFPLVLECRLLHTLEIGLHTQFVGEIVDVKADQDVLVDGRPALDKVMPLLYGTGGKMYYKSGPFLGKGFSIGRGYMA
ncbi:NADH-FMN oxidoreductase RutF, flavin reductase (DIM6/NTAB) family [Paucidesulfovibrio gracilis DSM 16080]|jgi:flavin reductase (DIM6/NTAB) family NADH-FMN oxidoreductase RutF|uniref:NADH-FMN oxidoreductase RutF, flavin reductase (DIM6/NTAB) family n=1 Tax=Paucidesulfovibrio gracilis DSM 16080 TaxID=1121449 RepID=A0A1T4XS33_9BACT|nr:flavin reductase family protein [Paucidesulfovibrio gracilis]SKA92183.1 NADH-FMN oxidoreductase RutF, flavin reductase (DIM6/NTAB) family [Paucidesulfovibrio gracilis DSM 16080]